MSINDLDLKAICLALRVDMKEFSSVIFNGIQMVDSRENQIDSLEE